MYDPVKIKKLPGTDRLGVAGDDLLDQSGARSRHADDEDRTGRWVAAAWFAPQQRGIEHIADALHILQPFSLVVPDLRAFERVACEQAAERVLVLLEVGIGLAERELQVDALSLGHRCKISR